MSAQFYSKLSQHYIELLNDDKYCDITIEVGEAPNVKVLRAHMNILCCRSPYLRRALTSKENNNNDNVLANIKLPNISPEIFQIILKYIYGGTLSLNNQDNSDIVKMLLAADELLLQELIDYLQKYLIENKSEWLEQHFELIHRKSFQSNSLLELQQFCTDFMAKSPEKIFKSFDFTSLPEKSLVQLIKRDDLQMKEIEVWEYVLKWGLGQNPTLLSDSNTWSDDDFKTMENTLQHCLPFIRFFSLSSKDFLQKVRPYRNLIKHQLYEDLLNSHLDPDSEPTDNIPLSRNNFKVCEFINSKIVSLNIILTISKWIDRRMIVNDNFAHIRELYTPYKFELLLRGSRDGFTPGKFHELCDNKCDTITFIKVKGIEEIIGGYNPIIWDSSKSTKFQRSFGKTKDSFIFSFRGHKTIVSRINDTDHAVYYKPIQGPQFGCSDIVIFALHESENYKAILCKKDSYEKKIRETEDQFLMEDYEVFQIIKK